MLVLTRKAGERIIIDEDIEIIVLKSSGGRVRLGIEAPRDKTVRRQELAGNCIGPQALDPGIHRYRHATKSTM